MKKGTFEHALQYRGHFSNGTLMHQEHTDVFFYSAVLLSPAVLSFPSTVSLFSNPQHELVLPVTPETLIYKVHCRPALTAI